MDDLRDLVHGHTGGVKTDQAWLPNRGSCDQAVPASVRYRYNVARLTPRYLAMSLAVWPSAFIRFAVAMNSEF